MVLKISPQALYHPMSVIFIHLEPRPCMEAPGEVQLWPNLPPVTEIECTPDMDDELMLFWTMHDKQFLADRFGAVSESERDQIQSYNGLAYYRA
jgi:hypothetical protein